MVKEGKKRVIVTISEEAYNQLMKNIDAVNSYSERKKDANKSNYIESLILSDDFWSISLLK